LPETGSDVAACTTRVKDPLRRRLRKPDRRLRSLALRVGESGTTRRRSCRRRGLSPDPEGSAETRKAQSTRRPAPGLGGRSRALEAPRPYRSERRFDPPPASRTGCKQLEHRRVAPETPSSPTRSVESARPGWRPLRSPPRSRGRLRREMRRTFRRMNPLFQRTSTRAPRRLPVLRAFARRRRVSRFMTLHSLRITRVRVVRRRFVPTPRANRLSSDASFLDRFTPDPMNGAGALRPETPSIAEAASFARVEFPRSGWGRRSSTSATDVKVEHTRERRVTPPARAS
jgi:hypothetical protein